MVPLTMAHGFQALRHAVWQAPNISIPPDPHVWPQIVTTSNVLRGFFANCCTLLWAWKSFCVLAPDCLQQSYNLDVVTHKGRVSPSMHSSVQKKVRQHSHTVGHGVTVRLPWAAFQPVSPWEIEQCTPQHQILTSKEGKQLCSLCFAKDLTEEYRRTSRTRSKSKNECWKNLHCFLALQRLRPGILRRDFGHSLCCSDLQSTTDCLGCCSPGGKHAKLIKHKAFGMPSGVFCSFRSGRRFFGNKPKARPGISMRLVMPKCQQHFCWELKEALDSHPF